ncbi:hypothetical protein Lal_00037782 [Lupinus albus]|nr:hypothetical protein Lal_00037782 [Lupinus albus]
MESEGQKGTMNPSAMLASLLSRRAKLHEELRSIEKQVYDMETSYLQDPGQCGNVLKGFEGFLSSSKNTAFCSSFHIQIKSPLHGGGWWLTFQSCSFCGVSGGGKWKSNGILVVNPTGIPGFLGTVSRQMALLGCNSVRYPSLLSWLSHAVFPATMAVLQWDPTASGIDLKRSRKFQPEDRLFSLSSVTSPAAEEIAAGRDDGRSDFGPGRSKGGGIYANGQGKPKKGRGAPRDAKRMRASSEQDFDYEDDPDLTL